MKRFGKSTTIVAIFLLSVPCNSSTAQDRPKPARRTEVIAEFKVFRDGDHLLVPVTVGGKVYPFVFDTGATYVVYDKRLKPRLGSPQKTVKMTTPNGNIGVELFEAPNASIGTLSLKTQAPVACLDLGWLRDLVGYEVYALVGMSFLNDKVVRIDFDRGRLAFLISAPRDGEAMPMVYRDGIPAVELDLQGLGRRTFTVDTGSSDHMSGCLCHEDFSALVDRHMVTLFGRTSYFDLSGERRDRNGTLEGLFFGPFDHRGLTFKDNEGSTRNHLGLGFWKQYNLTFDFPAGTVYVRKSRQFGKPEARRMSGLELLRKDGHVRVQAVNADSAGARCGIRAGDQILKVGSELAGDLRFRELNLRLNAGTGIIHLTVQRGESVFDTALEYSKSYSDRTPVGQPKASEKPNMRKANTSG